MNDASGNTAHVETIFRGSWEQDNPDSPMEEGELTTAPDDVEVSFAGVMAKEEEQDTPEHNGTELEKEMNGAYAERREEGENDTKGSHDSSDGDDDHDDGFAYPIPTGDVTCWKLVRSPTDFCRLTWGWLRLNKTQVLSGVTVALAQVPEAVSFSFVAGVDPIVGLQSAWIMGLMTSWFGGRPGMVAGSTGAIAVVLTQLVEEKGKGHMFYAIMLAGILQMIFGLLRLGVLVRMIPHPVMVGFCNGLGIVIGMAQFNAFKIPASQLTEATGERVRRLAVHIGGAFSPFTNGRPWVPLDMGLWMAFHVVVTLLTYIFFPRLTKAIPGSLAGIILSTSFEWALIRQIGFETNTVKDLASVAGVFPVPVWVDTFYGYKDIMPPINATLFAEILPTAITAGSIGLLESLLTLQIMDELTNTKGSSDREAFGQGLGQFLSGAFGGMGGCTTIGQSLMNIHSGGFTRLSSSVAAIFMLLIILVVSPLINLIPVASLAGVMFVVTYFTIEWESGLVVLGSMMPECWRERFGYHTKVKRSDVFVMLSVVTVTLLFDLAIAVAFGIVMSCLIFAWDAGRRVSVDRQVNEEGNEVLYTVRGPIFFASVKPLISQFPPPTDDPPLAYVLLEDAEIYDWSGMVAIKTLHDRFSTNGTTVHFQKLSVASHRLMHKSKKLWEDVNVFTVDEEDVDESFKEVGQNIHADNQYHAHL